MYNTIVIKYRLKPSLCRFLPFVDVLQCSRRHFFKFGSSPEKQYGYYIMFPDIPSDTASNNELLRLPTSSSTQFSKLNAEKCVKAVAKSSIQFDACIDKMEEQLEDKKMALSLHDVIEPIERSLVPLDFSLVNMRTLRNVDHNKYKFVHFDNFYNRINSSKGRRFQSRPIYYFMREINSDRDKLNSYERRLVDKYLLEAKLFGTHLSDNEFNKLNFVNKKLAEEKNKYRLNVDEATRRFTHTVDDPSLLRVFPDELIAAIGSHNHATVTLDSAIYTPFMEYCPDRSLRHNLWLAYNSRASPSTDIKISNGVIIEEIRSLRKSQARILGYDNYVGVSMETKMAGSLRNVKAMISTLHTKSKSTFDKNLRELTKFATESGSFTSERLELWDVPYWQRKLLKAKFSIEDSVIRQYFPLPSVLSGIFKLAEKLFAIRIEEVAANQFDPWHKDVRLFRILSGSEIIASFFFDPYERLNNKSSGNWLDLPISRNASLGTKPISYFVMNLPRPLINDQPVQISFSQLLKMFKQFGHILQHSLSEIPYSEISGISNLEWDTAFVCPEFFALWPLNSYDVISSCSSHIRNKSPLPESEFEKIRKAHFSSYSFKLKRELYKVALDLALYSNDDHWNGVMDVVWKEYMDPFTKERDDTHPCSFREIFCDDFPAAYFSFKWSEMLAADVFSAFQEAGLDNEDAISSVGIRFRDTFLALGGGCHSSEIFRRFRGRDPSPDAYLELHEITKEHKKDLDDNELGNEKMRKMSASNTRKV